METSPPPAATPAALKNASTRVEAVSSEWPDQYATPERTLSMDDKVIIFDTTLRDGEQAPGFSMNIEEKLRMARQLEKLGVDIIEAGFPIASQGDYEAVRRVGAEVKDTIVAGLSRAVRADIERCAQALETAK